MNLLQENLKESLVQSWEKKRQLSQRGSQAIQSRKGAEPFLRHLAVFWVGDDAFLPMMDIRAVFYFIWNQELALKWVLLHEIYGPQNAEDLPMAFMF